jgi:hypothetical protein
MGPAPYDLCAVAINMAARMSYRAHCAWIDETTKDRFVPDHPAWEELPADKRTNAVGFVMTLAANPRMDLDNIHDMLLALSGDAMPENTRTSLALCPTAYRVSFEISVNVVRAVLRNLVSERDMKDYMNALDAGTDEFMVEN